MGIACSSELLKCKGSKNKKGRKKLLKIDKEKQASSGKEKLGKEDHLAVKNPFLT